MAPVFSQNNEFVHRWGLDFSFRKCVEVSVVQYRATMYWSFFVQIAYRIANAKIIDDKSYMHKFRLRAFHIESVIDFELPLLANSFAPETSFEWKEFSSDENSADKMVSSEECFTLDEEWKQLEESLLSHVVLIHNQIFGSSDLVQTPGIFEVTDEDRLHSFTTSFFGH